MLATRTVVTLVSGSGESELCELELNKEDPGEDSRKVVARLVVSGLSVTLVNCRFTCCGK